MKKIDLLETPFLQMFGNFIQILFLRANESYVFTAD